MTRRIEHELLDLAKDVSIRNESFIAELCRMSAREIISLRDLLALARRDVRILNILERAGLDHTAEYAAARELVMENPR